MLATKSLVTRQDLVDLDARGDILLRPGIAIVAEGININKVVSREELYGYTWLIGPNFPATEEGESGDQAVNIGGYFEGENFIPYSGITFESVTKETYTFPPAIDGIRNNSLTVTSKIVQRPTYGTRATHYGTDTNFNQPIISPYVGNYSDGGAIMTVTNDSPNSINLRIVVGKTGYTQTEYSRSTTGTTNLGSILRLGNYFKLSVGPTAWSANGYINLEVYENGVMIKKESLYKPYNDPATGRMYINEYFRILKGISYEFKAYVILGQLYEGAFSNLTGQRACNLNS